MSRFNLVGKRRAVDRTGQTVGPYVVLGPVGADWRTTHGWRIGCPACGHSLVIENSGFACTRRRRSCGRCGHSSVNDVDCMHNKCHACDNEGI